MLPPFRIHEPTSVTEASRLLQQYGEDAALYAGGTELLLVMKERLADYAHLVNVKTIPGLDAISVADRMLQVGAAATHRAVETSPVVRERLPILAAVASRVGNLRVRNVGTLGGNLCFAEPHSDPGALLVALGATLVLGSTRGERPVPAGRFFAGILQTDRAGDEVLTRVEVPLLPASVGTAYRKIAFHERPAAGVAVRLAVEAGVVAEARVAVGSVGPAPARAQAAEAALERRPPEDAVLREAAAAAAREVDVLDDVFNGSDYKRHLVRVLTLRALREAVDQARGSEA